MAPIEPVTFTEAVGPYLPLIGLILSGLLVGTFQVWNRRRGAVETKAPDVTELWAEQEKDRRLRRLFEDLFYGVRGAYRGYVRRVQAGGSTELTPAEREAHDSEPRTSESR